MTTGTSKHATRVGIISLGCAKNLVDTEVMLGHLDRAGCVYVQDPSEAEILVVNTCGFIGPAREESIRTILEATELKTTGNLKRLVVAGCMVQRYHAELSASLPEVDAFVGLDELERIVERSGLETAGTAPAVAAAATHDPLRVVAPPTAPGSVEGYGPSRYLYDHDAPRRLATPSWTAFVKIAEGCDHTCSFCAIPSFRGGFRSRTIESVVREARGLAEAGVVEINLVAQDSSHFGRDRDEREGLARLLEALDAVDGLRWVRVHYLYPNTVTDTLIDAMARLPRVVKYVDMPLQHAHPDTLRRMRRGSSGEHHLALLERFRRAMPGAALRSTFIVGFPGETDEEFDALLAFVRAARFDHLGVFTYSHEDRTSAWDLADDIPEDVKDARRDAVMQLQRAIVEDRLEQRIGETVDVLVEGPHPETDLLLVGRMPTQAPDVDGQILINDGVARPGTIVRVELTETAGYDLVGRIVDRA
jgi:ribosomal protein S12 methylthiotransferase